MEHLSQPFQSSENIAKRGDGKNVRARSQGDISKMELPSRQDIMHS